MITFRRNRNVEINFVNGIVLKLKSDFSMCFEIISIYQRNSKKSSFLFRNNWKKCKFQSNSLLFSNLISSQMEDGNFKFQKNEFGGRPSIPAAQRCQVSSTTIQHEPGVCSSSYFFFCVFIVRAFHYFW